MIIEVLGPDDVRVVDVDDLGRVHLALGMVETTEADAALRAAGLGRLEEETGFLTVAALRAAAQPQATAPGWAADWDAMVASAGSQGRMADGGVSLQVTVEPAASG